MKTWIAAIALASAAAPAIAGPPYLTDDPETTDLRHWEIYNFVTFDGRHADFDGAVGFDFNYGAAEDLQLTATVPIAFSHARESGWHGGRGDLELAAKYRFVNDEKSGWRAAVFPRVILPTSTHDLGGKRVRVLLPVWVQKDIGKTSVFGGGGYEINRGADNQDFWQAGMAVTHDVSEKTSIGAEVAWQSADTRGGNSTVGVDGGLISKLGGPCSLLLSGGPNFSDGKMGYRGYAALGLNF